MHLPSKRLSPVQLVPFPVNPTRQVQEWEPIVLLHVAFG